MGTKVKTLVGILAGCALLVGTAAAQTQSPSGASSLDATLHRSLAERVQMPVVFATHDSLFALSLPTDEPATIFLQVTVGKNGKVKEKLTRINANHIAGYVAPVFTEAAKGLRIDPTSCRNIAGKDTAVTLTFPLEYQCVMDTTIAASRTDAYPYRSRVFYDNVQRPLFAHNRQIQQYFPGSTIEGAIQLDNPYTARLPQPDSYSGPVSYYLVFLKDQPE